MKITIELLDKLISWKQADNDKREFDIRFDRHQVEPFITIYDGNIVNDLIISELNVNEDWTQYMIKQQKECLIAELERHKLKYGE